MNIGHFAEARIGHHETCGICHTSGHCEHTLAAALPVEPPRAVDVAAIARKWRIVTDPEACVSASYQVPVAELRALCLAVLDVPPPAESRPGDGGFPVRRQRLGAVEDCIIGAVRR